MSAFAGILAVAAFTCVSPAMDGSAGTVEIVREVPVVRDLHAFDWDATAHSVRPETAEELTVRLDTGPLVVFTQRDPHRLSAGQRVRVQLTGGIARVERESAECAGVPIAAPAQSAKRRGA